MNSHWSWIESKLLAIVFETFHNQALFTSLSYLVPPCTLTYLAQACRPSFVPLVVQVLPLSEPLCRVCLILHFPCCKLNSSIKRIFSEPHSKLNCPYSPNTLLTLTFIASLPRCVIICFFFSLLLKSLSLAISSMKEGTLFCTLLQFRILHREISQ